MGRLQRPLVLALPGAALKLNCLGFLLVMVSVIVEPSNKRFLAILMLGVGSFFFVAQALIRAIYTLSETRSESRLHRQFAPALGGANTFAFAFLAAGPLLLVSSPTFLSSIAFIAIAVTIFAAGALLMVVPLRLSRDPLLVERTSSAR